MKAQPAEQDLLAIALETLETKLIPSLSGADRYNALMIANALGMVSREISEGGESELLSGKILGAAYGEDRGRDFSDLAADIRTGRLDGREDIAGLVLSLAHARCHLSNPKAAATYTG
tara:strand:+ start:3452 stop:3805 length:354 start_codon:yes stop_codon:yes gene_type:complete